MDFKIHYLDIFVNPSFIEVIDITGLKQKKPCLETRHGLGGFENVSQAFFAMRAARK
jgi:hypothetical protein